MSQTSDSVIEKFEQFSHKYDQSVGHGWLSSEERAAWAADLPEFRSAVQGKRVLEVGCGSGVFTEMLLEWRCRVDAIEPGHGMRRLAEARLASADSQRLRLIDARAEDFAGEGRYEAIVSRQVVFGLADPLAVFFRWSELLVPGGIVGIIDGFWEPKDWTDWDDIVEDLPLAAPSSFAPVSYLLRKAGFLITHQALLTHVNRCLGATDRNQRFMLLAQRPS